MNTQNCPAGFATDESLRSGIAPLCDVNLAHYDAAIAVLLFVRFITWVLSWHDWLSKKRRYAPATRKGAQTIGDFRERRKWEQRFPVVPLIGTLLLILWLFVFLLVRYNASSATNGVTFFFWALTFNLFSAYSLLFQRKLIRLGKRVIPISKAKLQKIQDQDNQLQGTSGAGASGSNTQNSNNGMDQLQYMDYTLSLIWTIQLICLFVQTICGCVLGLIFTQVFTYLQIAFALEGIFIFGNGAAIVYQMYRVTTCVKQSTMESTSKAKVLQKIHSQQVHFMFIASISSVVNLLLAAGVIPAQWYMLLYWIIIETSVSSFSVIEMAGKLCFGRRRGQDDSNQIASSPKRIGDENGTATLTSQMGGPGGTKTYANQSERSVWTVAVSTPGDDETQEVS